jgi:hypothetical protein
VALAMVVSNEADTVERQIYQELYHTIQAATYRSCY